MRSFELHSLGRIVVEELGTSQSLRGRSTFNPVNQVPDDVVSGISCGLTLAEHPGAISYLTVASTTDAEEAVEVVQLIIPKAHSVCHMQVVSHALFSSNNVILHAVVLYQLTACSFEGTQIAAEA